MKPGEIYKPLAFISSFPEIFSLVILTYFSPLIPKLYPSNSWSVEGLNMVPF